MHCGSMGYGLLKKFAPALTLCDFHTSNQKSQHLLAFLMLVAPFIASAPELLFSRFRCLH